MYRWFVGEKINNKNTHGTGCTLSSAIACGLAKGMNLEMSIQLAKNYISGALKAMLDLGKGSGPLTIYGISYKISCLMKLSSTSGSAFKDF